MQAFGRKVKVYRIEGLKLPEGRKILTLGSFDGLHLGHLSLVDFVKRGAKEKGIPSCAMIFDPRVDGKSLKSLPFHSKSASLRILA